MSRNTTTDGKQTALREESQAYRSVNALHQAIARSQQYLLSQQREGCYWIGELIVDVTLVADMVAYHHWNGKVDREWERKAVNHIFSLQLPEGGWNIYYGGPSEVNATIKAYLALKLAGVPITDPRMLKAREIAKNLGGVPRMNTFSKLYLALLGLYPWKYVPTIPCEVILLGKWFHVNFHDMSNWTRAMLVPLAIINHFKPTRRPNPPVTLDELYPDGYKEHELALAPDPKFFSWRNFFVGAGGHSPLPADGAQTRGKMDAGALRGQRRTGGHFPGHAQFADCAEGAGLPG
jgi:squalene-hopene/tetraprenyl-beta-curcumene cyclase